MLVLVLVPIYDWRVLSLTCVSRSLTQCAPRRHYELYHDRVTTTMDGR